MICMEEEQKPEAITARKEGDFSEWYVQVLIKSGFVDYSAVSGMLVYKPEIMFIWDTVKAEIDRRFKKEGIKNAYFPMLIPERLFKKEQAHVEGFMPEVAWVTQAGDTELDEKLAIRPTSETIMYDSFAKWIRSWRNLPLRLNQWNSVIRWEFKHPIPLLRTREFLWNEGHTVFATREEADAERDAVLGIYQSIMRDYLALSGIAGRKTDNEKFAGAEATYSVELLMPDGWAIQGPDWHSDGQNFSKAFGIKFIDKDSKEKFAYQNTFAFTTRLLGTMVAIHGDNKGLVIPPKVAITQAVIIPIYDNDSKWDVVNYAASIQNSLKEEFRTELDKRDEYSPGWKFNEWELKGVPLRIEVGKRELTNGDACIVRRDNGTKANVKKEELQEKVRLALASIHSNLYKKSEDFISANTHVLGDYSKFKDTLAKGGFIQVAWCGDTACELSIKAETGAKTTNMPFDAPLPTGKSCIRCGKPAKYTVNFARSY